MAKNKTAPVPVIDFKMVQLVSPPPLITDSAFGEPEKLPCKPLFGLFDEWPLLVFAPHPDDETLGCGGLIAAFAAAGLPVNVVVVTDGQGSHPNSVQYPPDVLGELRRKEARAAVGELGLSRDIDFWHLPDGSVHEYFTLGTELAYEKISAYRPRLIAVPWRHDPHHDHQAVNAIVLQALREIKDNGNLRPPPSPHLIQYPVGAWESNNPNYVPDKGVTTVWRVDISAYYRKKVKALLKYQSQMTDMIKDDPTGITMRPGTLKYFLQPWEFFIEQPY